MRYISIGEVRVSGRLEEDKEQETLSEREIKWEGYHQRGEIKKKG